MRLTTAASGDTRAMSDEEPAGPVTYEQHRAAVLGSGPDEHGIDPDDHELGVWGVVFEVGLAEGASVTLVSLADGSTSLYASSGSVITGGGAVDEVATASRALVDAVRQRAEVLGPEQTTDLPEVDEVTLRALTTDGRRSATVHLNDAVTGRNPLSVAFMRGHAVIASIGDAGREQP